VGSKGSVAPISSRFGADRGKPIDRFYIERFLDAHSASICGVTLEVENDRYTRRFGGERVVRREVLHFTAGNPNATFVDDLAIGATLPSTTFDCVILTQTLQYIWDLDAAMATLFRILNPGGVLLVTAPGISQLTTGPDELWREYWRFTSDAIGELLVNTFGKNQVHVQAFGNVGAATAFLYGLAVEDVAPAVLTDEDPRYPLVVCGHATKPLTAIKSRAS
jgi:SAM-dependent methyltransferase